MPGLLAQPDPQGLLEYSVVYTDRSLNHMSQSFQQTMCDISRILKQVYHAQAVAVVPGSGTYGMEAVARQFATGQHCMVIRNGWFSYRWTQIFEMGAIPASHSVMKAQRVAEAHQSPFRPADIDTVVAAIRAEKPAVVFAPHVETSAGMILPDTYIKAVAEAVHEVGGLFVLDCIASGTIWVDMEETGVDVLCSAPQKGWSGPPCAGLVMMSERAVARLDETTSSSFACDLKKWHQIMQTYENGAHAYHATMPTDALRVVRDIMVETEAYGFDKVREEQLELGRQLRRVLSERGFVSVADEGFQAPGVIVCYTDDPEIHNGRKFMNAGLQIAAGVPLQVDEPADYRSFRIGLFGLDKLHNIDRTVASFVRALDQVMA